MSLLQYMAPLSNPGSYLIFVSSVFIVATVLYTARIDRSWQTLVYVVLFLIGTAFILLSISDIRTAIGLKHPLERVFVHPPAISTVTLGGTLICLTGTVFFLWLSHRASA
jgi:hypothetical protein